MSLPRWDSLFLVTGATGFIGSRVVARLVAEGCPVRACVHTTLPERKFAGVEYRSVDLAHPGDLRGLFVDVDVVFHCAGLVSDYGSSRELLAVNAAGTEALVNACPSSLKRFVHLSHIHADVGKRIGPYSQSKQRAERFLLQRCEQQRFPGVVLRPGNVYGPGRCTWVLRPLDAIQHHRIALIDHGRGIFLHTYVDNLVEAMLLASSAQDVVGRCIDITDGDNTITWGQYLNDLARMAGEPSITRNLPKGLALWIGQMMMLSYRMTGRAPLVTPTAVRFFSNQDAVSIDDARRMLRYEPHISYTEALMRIQEWLLTNHYIAPGVR